MSEASMTHEGDVTVRVGDLTRLLLETAQSIRLASEDILTELGLTDSQAGLLWELDPSREPPTMRSLAATMMCDPSNITLLGTALRRAGLVEQRPHASDGRARVLVLTGAGRAVWERLRARLEEASPLGALDAHQRGVLRDLLEAVQLVKR